MNSIHDDTPRELGRFTVCVCWGRLTLPKINIVGDVVYLTGPNLHIIDIADPEYPRFHSSWNQAGLRSMAVVNGTAYFGGINGVYGMSGLPVTP